MEEYMGDIKLFAGTFCPKGYQYCEGQSISINENQALFSILGTQYGGDGKVTFNLPNLSNQVMSKNGNPFFRSSSTAEFNKSTVALILFISSM